MAVPVYMSVIVLATCPARRDDVARIVMIRFEILVICVIFHSMYSSQIDLLISANPRSS